MPSLSFVKFAALWVADTAAAWLAQHWGVPLVALLLAVFVFTSASID